MLCAGAYILLVVQACLSLCNPMDCSPPCSSVHGDSLDKNTGVSCHALTSRGSSQPRDQTQVSCVSCISGGFLTAEPPGSLCVCVCNKIKHFQNSIFYVYILSNLPHLLCIVVSCSFFYWKAMLWPESDLQPTVGTLKSLPWWLR